MKTIIAVLLILLFSSLLYSQSSIVFDTGTIIDVGSGADINADSFTFNGINSGSGTFSHSTSAVDNGGSLKPPKEFSLSQNYPNPFNPSTAISFNLPSRTFVSLRIYDALGREVSILVSEELSAGIYVQEWNASNLPSGVYFYRLQAGSFVNTKKLLLIK
jgi:hypothetical protein